MRAAAVDESAAHVVDRAVADDLVEHGRAGVEDRGQRRNIFPTLGAVHGTVLQRTFVMQYSFRCLHGRQRMLVPQVI